LPARYQAECAGTVIGQQIYQLIIIDTAGQVVWRLFVSYAMYKWFERKREKRERKRIERVREKRESERERREKKKEIKKRI
jgi:hypothetical protein